MRRFIINVNGKSYDVGVEEVDAAASAPVATPAPAQHLQHRCTGEGGSARSAVCVGVRGRRH